MKEIERHLSTTDTGKVPMDMLMKFQGLSRVLTIIARGYMWKNDSEPQIDRARNAFCAWCSIPDAKKPIQKRRGKAGRITES